MVDSFPLWIPYCLASVIITTAMPLLQEKIKADAYAIAFWNKAVVALCTLPFVVYFGLPSSPQFYGAIFLTAILWCVADVIFFRAVPVVGAALVTRLIPSSIIIIFFLWFLFDPALVDKYLAEPLKSGLIAATVVASAFFAFRLKKCELSWPAFKMIWFVIFATCAGSILVKLLLDLEPHAKGAYSYVFTQALMMLLLWLGYYAVKKPVSRAVFFSKKSLRAGAYVGLFSALGVSLRAFAFIYVDNPAYLSVVLLLDSVLIALFNRLRGVPDKSDMVSGFGVVACALVLIILKST